MRTVIFILIAFIGSQYNCYGNVLSYQKARDAVIEAENMLALGGKILLSPKEKYVDKIIKNLKQEEIRKGFQDPSIYAPGMHFFRAKPLIEKSKVFKFIKNMPKGALLHGHNAAMASSEWVIKNLTYYPGMLKCRNNEGNIVLTFQRLNRPCVNIGQERSRARNREAYDKELEKFINLYTENPETEYLHITTVWNKFQTMFTTFGEVIQYLPAFRAYHRRILEEMYEDGVTYIEFRTSFGTGYDNVGNTYSHIDLAKELQRIVAEFKRTHPNFVGAKAIFSTSRNVNVYTIENKLKIFKETHKTMPDFMVGFDLVGQEDLGKPLYEFLPILRDLPNGTNYFFHAGETNWYGSSTDENVLDAILLNTKRIGHGFSIMKHPVIWNTIKEREIAIEINPISNQILHLVLDLRNHPAAFYVSENIPFVISSDDPGFWNAKGLAYDYYYAFMCFTSERSGLRSLKNLVWNSIKYSALTKNEKIEAAIKLQRMWDEFLDAVLEEYPISNQ